MFEEVRGKPEKSYFSDTKERMSFMSAPETNYAKFPQKSRFDLVLRKRLSHN